MRSVPPGILPVISIDRGSARPLYRQLYDGYREAIVERRLRSGQRLPSTRSLAVELQISRIPILNAFEQLRAEGYFESRTGSGTFVARALPEDLLTPPRRFSSGKPPARRAPRSVARRAKALLPEAAGPWLKGRGAFSVGPPPLDAFPSGVWARLAARHARVRGRIPPALWQRDGARVASRGRGRLPEDGARGPLRGRAGHDRQRVPAGARALGQRASRPRQSRVDRRAGLLGNAERSQPVGGPPGSGSRRRRRAHRVGRNRAMPPREGRVRDAFPSVSRSA